MSKTLEQLFEDFKKELMENDKKVEKEINMKSAEEKAKEFALFIKNNNCKVMGGKNGKTNKNS